MNDFERKLRQQPFREPPPELREAIFTAPANVIEPARWTWRDWLWPSPQVWGALAALWVIFAALSFASGETAPPVRSSAQRPSDSVTLLTFHHAHAHVFDLPD